MPKKPVGFSRFAVEAVLFALGVALGGCAALQERGRELDPSLLSHPAMDLHRRLTPERANYLTTLGPATQNPQAGGACAACAH